MPEDYWSASRGVAPLALAGVCMGAYTLFAVGLNVTKRMRLLPPLAVCGAGVAVGLYFALIPPFSFVGAAWGTAASMVFLALLVLAVSNRLYPVPWDWPRIMLAAAVTVGLCLASLAVDAWLPMAPSLAVRAGITLAFPLVLLALGFFPRSDLEAFRSRLRRRRRA
jgi:O-antigen/teichoic acid export membrane protein